MKCPYCGMHFSDNWIVQEIARVHRTGWFYRTALCPECTQMTIELCPPLRSDIMNQLDQLSVGEQHTTIQRLGQWRQVLPVGSNRGPVPPEVPKAIAADYVEACRVLPTSAKASAALSRRCLQTMLHNQGYKDRDLAKEIEQLLNAGVLPITSKKQSMQSVTSATSRHIQSTTRQRFRSLTLTRKRLNGVWKS